MAVGMMERTVVVCQLDWVDLQYDLDIFSLDHFLQLEYDCYFRKIGLIQIDSHHPPVVDGVEKTMLESNFSIAAVGAIALAAAAVVAVSWLLQPVFLQLLVSALLLLAFVAHIVVAGEYARLLVAFVIFQLLQLFFFLLFPFES